MLANVTPADASLLLDYEGCRCSDAVPEKVKHSIAAGVAPSGSDKIGNLAPASAVIRKASVRVSVLTASRLTLRLMSSGYALCSSTSCCWQIPQKNPR